MSVLQEILDKGFVDPEVLKQLGEEQKQILFIKMREEQLRKWRLWEAEQELTNGHLKMEVVKNGSRRVQWLNGKDGNVWVWVMGEHPNDLSIEQILEKEHKEKARQLAEKEIMQTLRKVEDLPNLLDKEESALKAELASIRLNVNGTGADFEEKQNSHSPYDDLLMGENGLVNGPSSSKTGPEEAVPVLPPFGKHLLNPADSEAKRSPLPFAPQEIYDNLANMTPPRNPSPTPPPYLRHFPGRAFQPSSSSNGTTNGMDSNWSKPPPVPEKPPGLRRTVSNSLSNGLPGIEQIAFNTIRSYIPAEEVQKRQSKIFERLKEQREQLEREADAEARRQEAEYEERERKAREAEDTIRRTVQRAREQHRKNLRTSDNLLPLFRNNPNGSLNSVRDVLRALPRPPKPKSRQAIVQWFRESELAQWKGQTPPKWFHGIISREEAEQLLREKSHGAFLVRVTERIFGYTISFRAEQGTKNFLVERIPDGYQFMGTNQLVHATLSDLIGHHQLNPITAKGGEILREPIGQEAAPADYEELFVIGKE